MTRRVLVIDNYDSFTYNLVQGLSVLGAEVVVRCHDEISVQEASSLEPTHLVISPGPGRPEHAGISMGMIQAMMRRVPVLGVCLGHQALAAVLGATIGSAQRLMHGKSSPVYHDNRTLFEGLPNPLTAGRYHSLAVTDESLPPDLVVSAYTSDGEIMGVRHHSFPTEGVQFHPESVLTPDGDRILRNFLDLERPGDRP
jgi:anthranilate synthase/aminodeoxychorismate synthase-like glutamine amidotransferase